MLITAALLFSNGLWCRRSTRASRTRRGVDATQAQVGIDGEQVLADARQRFVRLQAAWDARDLALPRSLTTPEQFEDPVSRHRCERSERAGAWRLARQQALL